jgi:hypothetical protein
VTHDIIEGAANWRAEEMLRRTDWIHDFTAEELAELDAALAAVHRRGLGIEDVTSAGQFPLQRLAVQIEHARYMLEEGPGLFHFRGIDTARYSKEDLRLMYWGIGRHLGTAVSQSMRGDLLGDVRDLGIDINSPQGRGYTSNAQLSYHTDSADVVGLMVLRTAKSGGLSMIGSSVAIHNEMARTPWRSSISPSHGAGRDRNRPPASLGISSRSAACTKASSPAAISAPTSVMAASSPIHPC